MTFGEQLRAARKAIGLSQAELGARVGVSNTYISALESSQKLAPAFELVGALAHALGISEGALWEAAKEEREKRLRERINGHSTDLSSGS